VIYFVTDVNLSVFSAALMGLASGVLRFLGGLCLTAGTVIRSGGCALSSASPWLCYCSAVRYVDILIFLGVYLVVLRDILLDSLESLRLR